MADFVFIFQDTATNLFIDWDCVWRSWTWKVFKTVSVILALKYRAMPMHLKYEASALESKTQVTALGPKYEVKAVGKKTSVVDKI